MLPGQFLTLYKIGKLKHISWGWLFIHESPKFKGYQPQLQRHYFNATQEQKIQGGNLCAPQCSRVRKLYYSLSTTIWRHWTHKMPVKYSLSSVWVREGIFSRLIHYKTHGAVCFQLTHFPCDDWENIYTLSYYHHRIGSMNYYPLFGVRSWNNGVRCVSFFILTSELLQIPLIALLSVFFIYNHQHLRVCTRRGDFDLKKCIYAESDPNSTLPGRYLSVFDFV